MLLQWFRGTSLLLHVPPGRRRISGWWSPLKFHCQNETRTQFRQFNSTTVGYALYVRYCGVVQPVPRYPGHQTRVAQVSRRAGGVSSQSACSDLQHPTFQAPWRHHYRSTCVQTIAIVIAIPPPSQHLCLGAAAGHAAHTTQGSRQFFMNTPHSLSEGLPAALLSISNQARPGTKAQ